MKRNFLTTILLMAAVCGFTHCSKKDKPVPDQDETENPEPPPPPPSNYEGEAGWTRLKPNTGKLNSVFFVNDSTGYVCGDKIARTTDRGKTWTSFTVPDTDFYELWFTDAAHGWALQKDKLYKTTDSGRTWTSKTNPVIAPVRIQFPTVNTGYMSGEGGLYKSTDGGAGWSNIAGFATHVTEISFYDSDYGCFVAEAKKPYVTTNGGVTFRAGVQAVDTIRSLMFSNKDHGWMLRKGATLTATLDAGISWVNPKSFGENAHQVKCFSFNSGYVLQLYSLYRVVGSEITQVLKTTNEPLKHMHYTDMDHGWAVSPADGGILYRYVKP